MSDFLFFVILLLTCAFLVCMVQILENVIRHRSAVKRLRRDALEKEMRRHDRQ